MTAVGLTVLRELTRVGFLPRVRQAAEHLGAGLAALGPRHGATVRGLGLLQALVLPDPRGHALVDAAREQGLLINSPRPELLRFMAALNVN